MTKYATALVVMLSACGYGRTVCSAVDLAHEACEKLPIRYMDASGRVVTVMVPRSELMAVARRHAP